MTEATDRSRMTEADGNRMNEATDRNKMAEANGIRMTEATDRNSSGGVRPTPHFVSEACFLNGTLAVPAFFSPLGIIPQFLV